MADNQKQIAVTDDEVMSFHRNCLVINGLDSSHDDKFTNEYVEVLKAGGIDAVNVTVPFPEDDFRDSISSYIRWRRQLSSLKPGQVVIVKDASDIEKAHSRGQIAVILGFQGGKPIEDDLGLIEVFHRLDIRIIQLTYNRRNYIGNGVSERVDGGLSKFGIDVVKELNRVGIVVDLAHVGERTALDSIEVSEAPPVVSHASARALCKHWRAISDTFIRAVADAGGVVGVAALSILLRDDGVQNGSTLQDYMNHLEHVIEVAGIDHVGIGFDVGFKRTDADTVKLESTYPEFKFPPLHLRYVTELNRADKAPNLTRELMSRGYSPDDIRKILGLNWMRVFKQVWKSEAE